MASAYFDALKVSGRFKDNAGEIRCCFYINDLQCPQRGTINRKLGNGDFLLCILHATEEKRFELAQYFPNDRTYVGNNALE